MPWWEALRRFGTPTDESVLLSPIHVLFVEGIEDCSLVDKEVSELVDHQALEIAGRDAPSAWLVLSCPDMAVLAGRHAAS